MTIPRGAWLPLVLVVCGCGRPALDCVVDARNAPQGEIVVQIAVSGVRGDTATFRGYAPATWLALDRIAATGPGERALPVRAGVDTVTASGVTQTVPSLEVAGPLPDRFTLRYVVHPGALEGDAHLGFTGQRFGF